MKKIITATTFLILTFVVSFANQPQEKKSLKEQAQEAFRNEHYNEAIALLEKAVKETPNDPEIWYNLGWFMHYLACDSRPMSGGRDYAFSERIFGYLDKAISLNPNYGDALYFYVAECNASAEIAMQDRDVEKLKYFYKKAYNKGGFPAWQLEFGRNFMNTCEENAILFLAGDAHLNICLYLQLHENFRTDISIIPLGHIERPWYVKFTRDGLDGAFRKVNINLTDRQIMDIRPYKWKSTPINIPISQAMRNELKLDKDFQFKWIVEPDLVEPDYLADKGTGEQAQARTFLSPRRAMLLQIVENNFADRPIHFSNFANPVFFAGLNPFFENRGLTSRLLPIETANTKHSHDFSKFENFLTAENLKDFHTMKTHDMPRVSWGFIWGYYTATIELARHYKETNQTEKLENLINIFKTYLAIGMDEENEVAVINWMKSTQ